MCGRVVSALSSDELLRIAKAKAINNLMKYRKSYNIGPERYLAGILKKNTNRNYKGKEIEFYENQENDMDNNENSIIEEKKIDSIDENEKIKIIKNKEDKIIVAENAKENLSLDKNDVKENFEKDFNKTLEADKSIILNSIHKTETEENYNPEFKYDLEIMKWGTENSKGIKIINARSETSDLYFKNMKKCVMVVQGYYEWKVTLSQSGVESKKPFYFKNEDKDKNYLLIAGLYKQKEDLNGFDFKQFIVLTAEANKQIEDIHDRMPLLLNDELAE